MHHRGLCCALILAWWSQLIDARLSRREHDVVWDDEAFIQELKERMKPRELSCTANETKADPRQFLHLHHMKTGGTSVDNVLSCAVTRLQKDTSTQIRSYTLSECSGSSYEHCINNPEDGCRDSVQKSAIMTYCAPLFQVNQFDWQDADAVTVLRHPVDRVWSMFRFETKRCYQCMGLKEFYKHVDNGTVEELFHRREEAKLCVAQLLNHQTRNLLTSPMSQDFTEEDQIQEALYNLQTDLRL